MPKCNDCGRDFEIVQPIDPPTRPKQYKIRGYRCQACGRMYCEACYDIVIMPHFMGCKCDASPRVIDEFQIWIKEPGFFRRLFERFG